MGHEGVFKACDGFQGSRSDFQSPQHVFRGSRHVFDSSRGACVLDEDGFVEVRSCRRRPSSQVSVKVQGYEREACAEVLAKRDGRVIGLVYRHRSPMDKGKMNNSLFHVLPLVIVLEEVNGGGISGSKIGGKDAGIEQGLDSVIVEALCNVFDAPFSRGLGVGAVGAVGLSIVGSFSDDFSSVGEESCFSGMEDSACGDEALACISVGCERELGLMEVNDEMGCMEVMEHICPIAMDCSELINHNWVKENVVWVAEKIGVSFGDQKAKGEALLLALADNREKEVSGEERALVVHHPHLSWKGAREVRGLASSVNYDGRKWGSGVRDGGRGGGKRRE